MPPRAILALVAVLSAPSFAAAGPLLSATLRLTLPGLAPGGVPFAVTSTSATGTMVGSSFRLDAGSWFVGQHEILNGNWRSVLTLGPNGMLSGTLGQATFSPTAGIPFDGRELFRDLTVFVFSGWPLGELAEYAHITFPTPRLVRPATHGGATAGYRGDRWHLGQVTQSQLTLQGEPIPDAAATGSVSVTASGNVHVNLVSLSRIFGSDELGSSRYRLAFPARLELVFLPEPASAALLLAAASTLAAARRAHTRA